MKRTRLAFMALAVGLIYSFPNWWWHFTLPNFSVVRGYILSDNDLPPYAAALTASADGRPPLTYFLGVYENRNDLDSLPASYWLTNFVLGNLLRLLGSLELLSAVGLFLSGAATFLLIYALARGVRLGVWAALAASLFACFRYPFYVGLLAAARQLATARGQVNPSELLSLTFPGMVNGWQLYPYLRWPVPGMMYWWFLGVLLLSLNLARRLADPTTRHSSTGLIVGIGLLGGLTAFIYLYFWMYLAALLGLMAALGWLAGQRRWLRSLGAAALLTLALGTPLVILQRFEVDSKVEYVTKGLSASAPAQASDLNSWMGTLAVHGVLAAALVIGWREFGRPVPPTGASRSGLGRFWARASETARLALERPDALWLFSLHGTVALLGFTDVIRFNVQAWHWPKYVLDNLAPITAAWIVIRLRDNRAAGRAGVASLTRQAARRWALWAAACAAACLVIWGTGRASLPAALSAGLGLGVVAPAALAAGRLSRPGAWLAGALAAGGTWPFYHRAINEMGWVALLPLAVGLAGLGRSYLRTAAWAFTGLNVLTAVCLQGWVRPLMARDFFTVQPEYAEALRWLRQNTQPDSVVVTNGWTSDYMLRSYTYDLTLGAVDWWSGTTRPDRRRRYMVRTAIYRVPPDVMDQLLAGQAQAVQEFKANVGQHWIGGPEMDLLSERQGLLLYYSPADYGEYYTTELSDLLGRFEIDYIWVGPWEREVGRRDFSESPELTPVFENSLIQIYQVNQEPNEAQADGRHSKQ